MEIWHLILWAVLTVVLIVVELVTVELVAVWFAAGSLASCITTLAGGSLWVQLIVFLAVSVLLLIATRPIVRSILKNRTPVATNADSLIGTVCVVKETINNVEDTGRVFADGLMWTARSADGTVIPAETHCIVESIAGVKLIVRPAVHSSGPSEQA